MRMVKAPFTPEQVDSFNSFQHRSRFHPFTCGNKSNHTVLVAAEDGWCCQDCDYTQDWAHSFMADWSWKPPEGDS